jgi:predicted secreted protein
MGWATGIAVYLVVWWLVLFMVLPFGVRRTEEGERVEGEDPGAPAKPKLLIKFAATTLIAGVIFAIIYWVEQSGLVAIRP